MALMEWWRGIVAYDGGRRRISHVGSVLGSTCGLCRGGARLLFLRIG